MYEILKIVQFVLTLLSIFITKRAKKNILNSNITVKQL